MALVRSLALILVSTAALAACGRQEQQNMQANAQANAQAQNEAAPAAPEPAGILDRSHAGSKAPATAFEDPAGDRTKLADFRGTPVLVNLWATWCGPCVIEMPTLDALAARDKGKLKVLTVSQDLEGRAKVDPFFDKHKFANIEAYLDSEAQLSTDLAVQTLPTTILYDAKGVEVWRISGGEDWNSAKAAALLKEATGSPPT